MVAGTLDWAVDTADELIVEFGKPMSFYREVEDQPQDENKPWKLDGLMPDPPEQFSVIAMTVPYSSYHIDGTVIRASDVKCLLAAKGLEYVPQPGDYSEFGDKKWKVINVSILEPGVERVLYEMQMRA